jgi:hypothetical protein
VQRGLLLDVVVGKSAPVLELLSGEDQALLVWGNALLILDLLLDDLDRVGCLRLKGDGLAGQCLNEDLHGRSSVLLLLLLVKERDVLHFRWPAQRRGNITLTPSPSGIDRKRKSTPCRCVFWGPACRVRPKATHRAGRAKTAAGTAPHTGHAMESDSEETADDARTVILMSSTNDAFVTRRSVIVPLSGLVSSFTDAEEDGEQEIPLPIVSSAMLSKILEFAQHHADDPSLPIEKLGACAPPRRRRHAPN